ncbi:hypothetical protein PTTG_29811 [Puccinia triticina 1-1 BBBD Race 1]|uniref:Uncharacterized protein n=1 Tax=Puccinia triticina (isolate 1-1 / race 1 (BBBD)) TaxID=630390 RepID=A0A180G1M7_PUCT1|nr:hypothetical protein PTTG_29811 [Puccinia triticina 1-1 BBBD Race 1]
MGQTINILPIFGNFKVKNRNFLQEPPSSRDFSEIQKLLIDWLSSSQPNSEELIRLSTALIGYWCKNHQSVVFKQSFKDDQDFWDTVTEVLKPKFNSRGKQSLIRFFSETKTSNTANMEKLNKVVPAVFKQGLTNKLRAPDPERHRNPRTKSVQELLAQSSPSS